MIFHMGSHKEFAEWLDEKITRLGISQTQLAKASGLSVSQISRIIRLESIGYGDKSNYGKMPRKFLGIFV